MPSTVSFQGQGTLVVSSASASSSVDLPTGSGINLCIGYIVATPDVSAGTPAVTWPSGWNLIGELIVDTPTTTQDLYVGAWWSEQNLSTASAPTVSVSSGFIGGSRRWSARIGAYTGYATAPTQSSTNSVTSGMSTPYTPPSLTLLRQSAIVSVVAQRSGPFLTLNTANGFTKHVAFDTSISLGGLSRAANTFGKSNLTGTPTMPSVNVSTSLSTDVIGAISFDIPEVPVDTPDPATSEWGIDRIAW